MRKKDESLRQAILSCATEVVNKDGPNAINIRMLAKKVGIATGTFYNYFSNKDEILLVLTEEYWRATLMGLEGISGLTFDQQISEIYSFLYQRVSDSAGILMSSLQSVESAGRERMASMQNELQKGIVLRIEEDPGISDDIWDELFTKENYANFIMTNIMINLRMKMADIDFFIEIIKRTLYSN